MIFLNGTNQRLPTSDKGKTEEIKLPTQDVYNYLDYQIEYGTDGKEKKRKILQTVRNFETVIQYDDRFAGKIQFNSFSNQIFLTGSVPWESNENFRPWGSGDDGYLFSIIQAEYGLKSRNDFFNALNNVALSNRFHPVRDILDSLQWDGEQHIRRLLPDYLGAEDSEYTAEVMKLFLLGGIARVYHPGCKFDYTIILQGPQGIGKSTFLRLLALDDAWFNDSLDSLDSDKAAQSLMGSWIIELAELKSLARTAGGVDSVKRFLTATQDKYRVPYERRADIFLRQSVFAGTTNKSDFLQDETGNRRFLIIQTGIHTPKKSLFNPECIDDIKAAWAEAIHIYKNENPRLILPESCRDDAYNLQSDAMVDDGKIGIIEDYLVGKQRTCAIEIWSEALHEFGRPAKWQASEINNIVSNIPGWQRMKSPTKFGKFGNQRGFQKLQDHKKECGKCSNGFMDLNDFSQGELPFE